MSNSVQVPPPPPPPPLLPRPTQVGLGIIT